MDFAFDNIDEAIERVDDLVNELTALVERTRQMRPETRERVEDAIRLIGEAYLALEDAITTDDMLEFEEEAA